MPGYIRNSNKQRRPELNSKTDALPHHLLATSIFSRPQPRTAGGLRCRFLIDFKLLRFGSEEGGRVTSWGCGRQTKPLTKMGVF